MTPQFMSVRQTAEYLNVSISWIYKNAAKSGPYRFGAGPNAKIRFKISDVEAWLKHQPVHPELHVLVCSSGIDLSQRGTRWRRLSTARRALLVLVHMRCGHTYAQLAAGFGVGVATVYRYIGDAVGVLAALAPDLKPAP
jgi:transposase